MKRVLPALVALGLLSCPSVSLGAFTGQVVSVLDGHTVELLHNGKTERIRLYGIDCPGKNQPYSENAKETTSTLVFAQEVSLHVYGKDKRRRILAEVFLADGTNVNHELIKAGWCRWYRKHAPKDEILKTLEAEAQDAKKGLWGDSNPVPLE